ncbi:MAG: DMT family transporter [Marinilabiliales bacterium]
MTLIQKIGVYVAILLAVVFWGTSFVWSKKVLEFYQPFTLIFFRLIISSVILFILALLFGWLKKTTKKEFLLFLLAALFQPFLYFIGEGYGIKFTTSSFSSVIIATIPLFIPFAAYFFLKDKIRPILIIGIILSFIGVYIMMSANGFETLSIKGILFLFLAVFSAVGYSIVVKILTGKFNPITIILYQNIIGIFYFLPFFIFGEMNDFIETGYHFEVLPELIQLGVFSSSVAFICFTYSISKIGVSKTSVFSNFIPVVTLIYAYFFVNESITWMKVTGMLVVIFGVTLSQINFKKKNANKISS